MKEKITVDPMNVEPWIARKIADYIRRGDLVALPSETVYGLAGRADRPEVVTRLYEVKQRPREKPFTYLVGAIEDAVDHYLAPLPPFCYRLMEKFWPGPLTLVYYSPRDKKIGVRVPSHLLLQEVLKDLPRIPVFFPSANLSGRPEAASAQEVESSFDGKVDVIVDGGKAFFRQSSTVLDVTERPFRLLREGVVSKREIIEVFIRKRVLFVCTGNTCRSPMAEVLLKKYLAEEKPYLQDRYEIISRGIAPVEGNPISPSAVTVLGENEYVDVRGFRAHVLDRGSVLSSDLIFTMEERQKEHILRYEPTAEGRVFHLKKFLPPEKEQDIPDPIGKGLSVYEHAYSLLKEAVIELREWL
ncbi:MAG: threonylcarbamoyl-AMP synthase [Candidatus Omnitrophica bacterium]|nr:threonylcarbamoyl-AMP synthase [Candidatus Omnitrophota bacterium]